MPKFAANLTTLFTERPLIERFAAAAAAGFEAVEVLFPFDHDPKALAAEREAHGLAMALINLPNGDAAKGERGLAALPGREADFRAAVDVGLTFATALKAPLVHVMAGVVEGGLANAKAVDTYLANLAYAGHAFGAEGIGVTIEPLNVRAVPNYLIAHHGEGAAIVRRLGHANVGLQFDFFHAQIMDGDVTTKFAEFLPVTRHVQIAGVPDRHEPDTGEVNYGYVFKRLDALGYDGYVGCEYHPKTTTEAGLGWFQPYRRKGG
jgi:hydroxypyruvate isomerase